MPPMHLSDIPRYVFETMSCLCSRRQGYNEDNKNIELLRLRSFTLGRKLNDSEVTNPRALENLVQIMGALTPFVS